MKLKCYSDCPGPNWRPTYTFERWIARPGGFADKVRIEHWACARCSALTQSETVLDSTRTKLNEAVDKPLPSEQTCRHGEQLQDGCPDCDAERVDALRDRGLDRRRETENFNEINHFVSTPRKPDLFS